MSELTERYARVTAQRGNVLEELKSLKEIDAVKRYIALSNENESLYRDEITLSKAIQEEKYASCDHILVYSRIDYDRYEGRTYRYCGCMKCGLDNSVLNERREWLPWQEKTMYDYLNRDIGYNLKGIETKIACDLDLAQALYSKIKGNHPDIADEVAAEYFGIALNYIRNADEDSAQRAKRAKRLSLPPTFNRWNNKDVHTD